MKVVEGELITKNIKEEFGLPNDTDQDYMDRLSEASDVDGGKYGFVFNSICAFENEY